VNRRPLVEPPARGPAGGSRGWSGWRRRGRRAGSGRRVAGHGPHGGDDEPPARSATVLGGEPRPAIAQILSDRLRNLSLPWAFEHVDGARPGADFQTTGRARRRASGTRRKQEGHELRSRAGGTPAVRLYERGLGVKERVTSELRDARLRARKEERAAGAGDDCRRACVAWNAIAGPGCCFDRMQQRGGADCAAADAWSSSRCSGGQAGPSKRQSRWQIAWTAMAAIPKELSPVPGRRCRCRPAGQVGAGPFASPALRLALTQTRLV
jgi:hypothetical protein